MRNRKPEYSPGECVNGWELVKFEEKAKPGKRKWFTRCPSCHKVAKRFISSLYKTNMCMACRAKKRRININYSRIEKQRLSTPWTEIKASRSDGTPQAIQAAYLRRRRRHIELHFMSPRQRKRRIVAQLTKLGYSSRQIGLAIGIAQRNVVRLRSVAANPMPKLPHKKIRRMLLEGASWREIHWAIGRPFEFVSDLETHYNMQVDFQNYITDLVESRLDNLEERNDE